MKLYVASRFTNYEQVRDVTDKLIGWGHTITYDWTRSEGEFDDKGKLIVNPRSLPLEVQQKFAYEDAKGSMAADALVLLYHRDMIGAWIEVGMALGRDKKVFLVGCPRFTIFCSLPNVIQFKDLHEFYRFICSTR